MGGNQTLGSCLTEAIRQICLHADHKRWQRNDRARTVPHKLQIRSWARGPVSWGAGNSSKWENKWADDVANHSVDVGWLLHDYKHTGLQELWKLTLHFLSPSHLDWPWFCASLPSAVSSPPKWCHDCSSIRSLDSGLGGLYLNLGCQEALKKQRSWKVQH